MKESAKFKNNPILQNSASDSNDPDIPARVVISSSSAPDKAMQR